MEQLEIRSQHLQRFKPESQQDFFLDAPDNVVEINNVFNINNTGKLPARFLGGFISTLSLAETIREQSGGKIEAPVRIFVPQNFTSFVDGIAPSVAEQQAALGIGQIHALRAKKHPNLDLLIDRDQPVTEEALDVLESFTNQFNEAVHTQPAIQDELERIRESAQRWGGENGANNATLYIKHHPFGWRNFHHSAIFAQHPPFAVINTLPPSEKRYTSFRKELIERVRNSDHANLVVEGEQTDLVISMCGTAHYLLIADQAGNVLEPTLEDLLATKPQDIIDILSARIKEVANGNDPQKSFLEDSLRKARRGVQELVEYLAPQPPEKGKKAKSGDIFQAPFIDLLAA